MWLTIDQSLLGEKRELPCRLRQTRTVRPTGRRFDGLLSGRARPRRSPVCVCVAPLPCAGVGSSQVLGSARQKRFRVEEGSVAMGAGSDPRSRDAHEGGCAAVGPAYGATWTTQTTIGPDRAGGAR